MTVVFSLSALWRRRIRGLWKFPDGIQWLRGQLGLVLMSRAMLSKSLIQFSVDGQSVFPPYYLTWGQTLVEVMKIMATSFKTPMHVLLDSVPPTLQQATAKPHLCQRLLDTHGQVWVSLLWGLLLLSPGSWYAQSFVCALQESVSPVLCIF